MSVKTKRLETGRTVYEVRWREGKRNRGRTFDLKNDADAWDREVKRRRQLGPIAMQQLTARGAPTLSEWIEKRWLPEHGSTLEQSTLLHYAQVYAERIEPWLGHLQLHELTVSRLREWQAGLLAKGRSSHWVTKARTMLSSVLQHAAESEAIPGNTLRLVRAPKPEHREEVQPLAPITVEIIRSEIGGTMVLRDQALITVLAYAGLRPAEMRALRWKEIRERTILVHRAVRPDNQIKSTKNRQYRAVKMLDVVAHDLALWRTQTSYPGQRDYVFATDEGDIMTKDGWNAWAARRWRSTCKRLDVIDDVPRPYDMRHSFASLLLAAGKPVPLVAEQLGHSSAMTLRIYGHVIAELADGGSIDPDTEIRKARNTVQEQRETTPLPNSRTS